MKYWRHGLALCVLAAALPASAIEFNQFQASKSAPQRSVVEFKAIGVRAKKRLPYALHVKP